MGQTQSQSSDLESGIDLGYFYANTEVQNHCLDVGNDATHNIL